MRNYKRLIQIAIEGFTDLNIWHLSNVEVVFLTMSSAKVVSLPADYINWTKVGYPDGGFLHVITNNENVLIPGTFEDGTEVGNEDATSGRVYFNELNGDGLFYSGVFGATGVDRANFRIDKEKRVMLFTGDVPRSQIILEYVSSGVKTTGSTMVSREAVPALRTYIAWQDKLYDSRVSLSEKSFLESQHDKEVEALRYFQNAFTIEEYKQMIYQTSHQAIKR